MESVHINKQRTNSNSSPLPKKSFDVNKTQSFEEQLNLTIEIFESNMLVAGKQIKRRAFQSSSAQATSLSRESKNLRLKKKSKPNIVMIIDQLRLCLRTSVSHQAPSSTVRIPHTCVLLVCAFFTTPPCVCQHNLWHCHVTVCATIMSQTKVFGRDPTPSYRGGSAIRQQTRQESFCTLSIENRFKSASSQEHFSPRSCS